MPAQSPRLNAPRLANARHWLLYWPIQKPLVLWRKFFVVAVLVISTHLLLSAAWAALSFPALTGRVVDQANILSAEARAAITQKSLDLEKASGTQLVVATVSSLQDTDIESYANALFRAWKLGDAKDNNGLLLLVAPNERKVRIEVGYGLEGVMTDALSSVIIRAAIVPKFKANDFSGGVTNGVDAVIAALTTDQSEWQARAKHYQDRNKQKAPDIFDQLPPFLILALFIFIVFSMMRNARGPSGKWRRRGNQTIFIPPTSSWGGGGWGGSDGGGFSGGGGSSGGGGASGDW